MANGGAPVSIVGTSDVATTLTAGTDRSGSITTGGTAQVLAPANPSRRGLTVFNNSGDDIWINQNGGDAGVGAAGSIKIPTYGTYDVVTNKAISVNAASTGQKWTATET